MNKTSYWYTGGNENFKGNWYWKGTCSYGSTTAASGDCMYSTFHDPNGQLNYCPGEFDSGSHYGLSGWANSADNNLGYLHTSHASNKWIIKTDGEGCRADNAGHNYCSATDPGTDATFCNIELYVR